MSHTPEPTAYDQAYRAEGPKIPKWILWVLGLMIIPTSIFMLLIAVVGNALVSPESIYRHGSAVEGSKLFTAQPGQTYYFVLKPGPIGITTAVPVVMQPVNREREPINKSLLVEPGGRFEPFKDWQISQSELKFLSVKLAPEVTAPQEIIIHNGRGFRPQR